MNIPERQGENCCDIVNDITENDRTKDHHVGKLAAQNDGNSTLLYCNASETNYCTICELTEQGLGVKSRLKKSDRHKDAYITKD